MERFNKYFANIQWSGLLIALGALVCAFLIFHAGVAIGSHRGPHLPPGHQGFRPPFGAPFGMPNSYIPRGHGAVGTIVTLALPTITIQTQDGESEIITISTSTLIDLPNHEATTSHALTVGSKVIIFGAPSETTESIDAKVIHVLP